MEDDHICKFCKRICKNGNSLRNHERLCNANHEHQISSWIEFNRTRGAWNKGSTKEIDARLKKSGKTYSEHVKAGVVKPPHLGKPLADAHKAAISRGMKIAHQEKRAHNIGSSRWNNEHSWPEKWLIEVLQNELNMVEHVDYQTEMPFDKYSLDFAWPEKKFCIEMDWEQHERFKEYKLRDISKDALLKENGLASNPY